MCQRVRNVGVATAVALTISCSFEKSQNSCCSLRLQVGVQVRLAAHLPSSYFPTSAAIYRAPTHFVGQTPTHQLHIFLLILIQFIEHQPSKALWENHPYFSFLITITFTTLTTTGFRAHNTCIYGKYQSSDSFLENGCSISKGAQPNFPH